MQTITPSADLYNKVRGGFVTQGTSFSKACEVAGIKRQAARQALIGGWTGPRATEVVKLLTMASGASIVEDHAE